MSKAQIQKETTKVEIIEKKISQQDVIELVAYKQIKKLEVQRDVLVVENSKLHEKLKILETKYYDNVLKEVKKLLNGFFNITTTNFDIKLNKSCDNKLNVFISGGEGYDKSYRIDDSKLSTVKNKTHVELEAKVLALKQEVQTLNENIRNIKQDKNSIKNAITEQLLLETNEGKDLLKLVESAYESSFPKLLK